MEQEQAPQTAAPAPTQAPAAPAPQAAPPPAAPAAPHVLPANYIPTGTRPTVDDVVNAFPQEAADAAGIPQRAEVNGETQLPGGGTAKGTAYGDRTIPAAGVQGTGRMPLGPGQVEGRGAAATNKPPEGSLAYKAGDKNNGMRLEADTTGRQRLDLCTTDDEGDGARLSAENNPEGYTVEMAGKDGDTTTRAGMKPGPNGPVANFDFSHGTEGLGIHLAAEDIGGKKPSVAGAAQGTMPLTDDEKLKLKLEAEGSASTEEQKARARIALEYENERIKAGIGLGGSVQKNGTDVQKELNTGVQVEIK